VLLYSWQYAWNLLPIGEYHFSSTSTQDRLGIIVVNQVGVAQILAQGVLDKLMKRRDVALLVTVDGCIQFGSSQTNQLQPKIGPRQMVSLWAIQGFNNIKDLVTCLMGWTL